MKFVVAFEGSVVIDGVPNKEAAETAVRDGLLGHIPDGIAIVSVKRQGAKK